MKCVVSVLVVFIVFASCGSGPSRSDDTPAKLLPVAPSLSLRKAQSKQARLAKLMSCLIGQRIGEIHQHWGDPHWMRLYPDHLYVAWNIVVDVGPRQKKGDPCIAMVPSFMRTNRALWVNVDGYVDHYSLILPNGEHYVSEPPPP